VTRGADGMTLFEPGNEHVHIPVASKSEGSDVTG
jgi:bifunctional ADP-heptose synthase (sugar kinase/adenylyltransferase)